MKWNKLFLCLIFVLFVQFVNGQMIKDVFPLSREFRKGGLYVAPLGTYSIGNKIEGVISDTAFNYDYETQGKGKFGYGIEVGWFHTFKGYQVGDFFEGGISYRRFAGEADHSGLLRNDTAFAEIRSANKLTTQFVTASFRAVDVINLEPGKFFTWGLGLNYNYLFSSNYQRGSDYPNSFERFQSQSSVQGHVQIGFGVKVAKKVLLMPTLETPLFTVYPTGDFNPAFTFFSAKYQPIIVGLRFMFLREDPVNCNAPQLMPTPGN